LKFVFCVEGLERFIEDEFHGGEESAAAFVLTLTLDPSLRSG
jgi:hypothetical protein